MMNIDFDFYDLVPLHTLCFINGRYVRLADRSNAWRSTVSMYLIVEAEGPRWGPIHADEFDMAEPAMNFIELKSIRNVRIITYQGAPCYEILTT